MGSILTVATVSPSPTLPNLNYELSNKITLTQTINYYNATHVLFGSNKMKPKILNQLNKIKFGLLNLILSQIR